MTLTTNCPGCNAQIMAELPDDTDEFDAAMLATKLFCASCARLRLALAASVAPDHAKTLPASQAAPAAKLAALPEAERRMGELLREP